MSFLARLGSHNSRSMEKFDLGLRSLQTPPGKILHGSEFLLTDIGVSLIFLAPLTAEILGEHPEGPEWYRWILRVRLLISH